MGEIILEQRQGTNEINDWHEAFMNKTKFRGKIAVMTLKQAEGKNVANHDFYHNGQIGWLLKNHIGKKNTYISLNSFDEMNGQLDRTAENVVQIRNIGIDIDCYAAGLTTVQAEQAVYDLIVSGEIPNPNLLIYSGNGLQLVYSIQGGVPAKLTWLTKDIASQLILRTSHLGSDMSCNDVARVFRMPYTVNEKPSMGTKPTSAVIWRHAEYDLSELYEFCTPIPKRKPKTTTKVKILPKLTEMGYRLRSLNQSRLNDFYKLIELRENNIEKRNVMTYDFAYILSLMTEDIDEVLLQTQRFNTNFDVPQSIKEVKRTTSRAFADGRDFWNKYVDNSYSMNGLIGVNEGIIKPKRNKKIIEEQEITAEEMRHLTTLIGKEEVYSRKVDKRRAAGVKERSEYEADRKSKKAQKIEQLRELRAKSPAATQRELAEKLGVTAMTINRYLKEL